MGDEGVVAMGIPTPDGEYDKVSKREKEGMTKIVSVNQTRGWVVFGGVVVVR